MSRLMGDVKEFIFKKMKEHYMSSMHYDDYEEIRELLGDYFISVDPYELDIDKLIKEMELRI